VCDECSTPIARAQRPRPVYLVLTPTNCETHEQHTTLPFPDNVNLRRCERGAALSAPQCVTALGLGCKTPRCPRSHVRPKALPSAWRPACGHRAGSWRWEQRKSTCQKRRLGTRPDGCRMHFEGADAESQLARAQRAPDDPPEGIEGQSVNTTCGVDSTAKRATGRPACASTHIWYKRSAVPYEGGQCGRGQRSRTAQRVEARGASRTPCAQHSGWAS